MAPSCISQNTTELSPLVHVFTHFWNTGTSLVRESSCVNTLAVTNWTHNWKNFLSVTSLDFRFSNQIDCKPQLQWIQFWRKQTMVPPNFTTVQSNKNKTEGVSFMNTIWTKEQRCTAVVFTLVWKPFLCVLKKIHESTNTCLFGTRQCESKMANFWGANWVLDARAVHIGTISSASHKLNHPRSHETRTSQNKTSPCLLWCLSVLLSTITRATLKAWNLARQFFAELGASRLLFTMYSRATAAAATPAIRRGRCACSLRCSQSSTNTDYRRHLNSQGCPAAPGPGTPANTKHVKMYR